MLVLAMPIDVYYDEAIYQRLSELDKALIEYHEDIYVLANLVGNKKADGVRQLVRNLFTLRFWSEIQHSSPSRSVESRNLQRYVGGLLGDYTVFFLEHFNQVTKDSPLGTPGSWHHSYNQAISDSRKWIFECAKQVGAPTNAALQECSDAGYERMLEGEGWRMSHETAFMLLVRFALDFEDVFDGSEWLLTFDLQFPHVRTPVHQEQLGFACKAIVGPQFEAHELVKKYPHLLQLSREYCRIFAPLNPQ